MYPFDKQSKPKEPVKMQNNSQKLMENLNFFIMEPEFHSISDALLACRFKFSSCYGNSEACVCHTIHTYCAENSKF